MLCSVCLPCNHSAAPQVCQRIAGSGWRLISTSSGLAITRALVRRLPLFYHAAAGWTAVSAAPDAVAAATTRVSAYAAGASSDL